jgi:predicted DCC family thiol-disulfide oxidoreductase YuxK
VNRISHVAAPPAKPLMLYDGDCKFCTLWIDRWQLVTGDCVEYLPFQDPHVATQFPEIPRDQFESAVQLILPDGSVFSAAEAVFRSLACNPQEQWLLDLYQHSPVFVRVSETGYRFVARHRKLFSTLTWLLWGRHIEPPRQNLVRWIFLRAIGIIYLIAFVSLWTQITGLVGGNGIAPANLMMETAKQKFAAQNIGADRYHLLPTLCWFDASDGFLKFQCAAGTTLAVLLILGIAPAPCLFLLWLIYLSLTTVCDVFLGFQWDNLLLETGFLAIFFAPLQWFPRRPSQEAPPSQIVLWLLRWLLFRLVFESGCVKLLSGDATWHNLTALNFHYETQPLPTWIGWYAYQLPGWFQKLSCAGMFGIELVIPFLIFLPRKPRQFACVAFVALQVLILLTGNYCFFNLLTLALCVTLLDDAAIQSLGPTKWRRCSINFQPSTVASPRRHWPIAITLPVAALAGCACYTHFFGFVGIRMPGPEPVVAVHKWLLPFRTFNSYGLFAVMTTSRPEIIVEGSNDRVKWDAYAFKYKPGDLSRRPPFVAPHQPRLDWQMWFAALGDVRQNPWFANFCVRLLQGSPEVLALLERNPFPNAPPRYLRAVVCEYHFTDLATRRATGEWWRREWKGIYLPPISINQSNQKSTTAQ